MNNTANTAAMKNKVIITTHTSHWHCCYREWQVAITYYTYVIGHWSYWPYCRFITPLYAVMVTPLRYLPVYTVCYITLVTYATTYQAIITAPYCRRRRPPYDGRSTTPSLPPIARVSI